MSLQCLANKAKWMSRAKGLFPSLSSLRSKFGEDKDYSRDHILLLSWENHCRERALGSWSHVQLLDAEMKEGSVVWIHSKSSKYFSMKWPACCQKKKKKERKKSTLKHHEGSICLQWCSAGILVSGVQPWASCPGQSAEVGGVGSATCSMASWL